MSLGIFVAKLLEDRVCPQYLEVRDPKLAEYLHENLAGTGIEVQLKDRLRAFDRVVTEMTAALVRQQTACRVCLILKVSPSSVLARSPRRQPPSTTRRRGDTCAAREHYLDKAGREKPGKRRAKDQKRKRRG
jgi:hypothetical protein